jgi:hypothetical protein
MEILIKQAKTYIMLYKVTKLRHYLDSAKRCAISAGALRNTDITKTIRLKLVG